MYVNYINQFLSNETNSFCFWIFICSLLVWCNSPKCFRADSHRRSNRISTSVALGIGPCSAFSRYPEISRYRNAPIFQVAFHYHACLIRSGCGIRCVFNYCVVRVLGNHFCSRAVENVHSIVSCHCPNWMTWKPVCNFGKLYA